MPKEKTLIQQLKEKMETNSILDAVGLRLFFLNNSGSRNSKSNRQNEAYATRIEKYGEKRFGKGWWK
jgi:hypothetical protein